MTHTRTFKILDELELLFEHGEAFRPSCWEDFQQQLPKNYLTTHYIFTIGVAYDELTDDYNPSAAVLIETREDFNLALLLNHTFYVVTIDKVADSVISFDKTLLKDGLFGLILAFPIYRPTSTIELKKYLPLNWEESYAVYVIAGWEGDNGINMERPVLVKSWDDIKYFMVFEGEMFVVIPISRCDEVNRMLKEHDLRLAIQSSEDNAYLN